MKTKGLILCVIVAFILALTTGSALAAVIYVPDNYGTIQAAVNAAGQYDTIIVRPGIYNEKIFIDFGAGPPGPKEGLTITSTDLHDCEATTINGGFFITSADNFVTIKGFKIVGGNDQNIGIETNASYGLFVFNCIEDCYHGIRIDQPGSFEPSFNTIAFNKITGSTANGIEVQKGTNNLIMHNVIENNANGASNNAGLKLDGNSSNSNVHHNTFKDNGTSYGGAYDLYVASGSVNNNIHQNLFCDKIILQSGSSRMFIDNTYIQGKLIDNNSSFKFVQNHEVEECPNGDAD